MKMEYIKPRRLSKTELRFLQEKINLFLTFLKTDVFSKLPSGRWTKLETFMANDDRGVPMDDEAKRYLEAIIETPSTLFEAKFEFNSTNTKQIMLMIFFLSFVVKNEVVVISFIEKYLDELLDYRVDTKIVKKIYVYLKLFSDIYG